MKTFNEIQNSLYQTLNTNSPRVRRSVLINEMAGLTNQKIHCFNCSGTCCTFSANSMKITPIEAFEILISLEVTKDNLSEIKTNLQKNIQDYRLDFEISLGRKNNSILRKTYTCPFFVAGSKGCTIKKDLKPYGCLGFNPRIENDNGGQCLSNVDLLEERENAQLDNEQIANDFLKNELKLDWEKLEIPKAVLSLLIKLY
ncbi:MAG: hypothetical protein EHM20_16540 [Alphaproteobacteria bacterium]|nr:MAG: hypothetical protein EHM20_16540 [Alphaproteobacteria bacterium]